MPHGFIFGGRAGYAFGSQWNSNNAEIGLSEPNYDTVTINDAAGVVMASLESEFDDWHLANIFYGATDGFITLDDDESASFSIAATRPNSCGGCTGAYQDTSLTSVAIGGFPFWPEIYCENYVGEVLIFDEKLTDAERETVTAGLIEKWGIPSSCDASGAITNGAPGECSSTLASGSSCTPTCDAGYTLSGSRSCSDGTFTDTAVCSGDSCDASNPITNGVLNDCTSTLADGTACTPTCNTG